MKIENLNMFRCLKVTRYHKWLFGSHGWQDLVFTQYFLPLLYILSDNYVFSHLSLFSK